MEIELNISNKTNALIPDKDKINQAIIDVLTDKKIKTNVAVDIEFVSTEEIHKLNLEYRKKDYPTDVLSFPIFDNPPKESDVPVLLGDIIICPEVAAKNAAESKISTEEEILNLIKHSVLHLLGFHHKGD